MKLNRLSRIFLALSALLVTAGLAKAQSLTVYADLHDFGGTVKNAGGSLGADGAGPWSNVTFDKAGNIYGTTAYGGPNSRGTIWELTRAGKYVDLHDFGGTVTNAQGMQGPDGEVPYGGVTFDNQGNLYGTACFGGPTGNANGYSGMVWEISSAGVYKDLHDFGSGSDGGNPCAGVAVDSAGDLFGTASAGGANDGSIDGAGMVWEITAAGDYVDLHDFGGTVTNANGSQGPDGYMSYAGVTLDSAGNLYGTASKSGPNGGGIVWEIMKGGTYVDLHDFGAMVANSAGGQVPDGELPYGSVTVDGDGNLYGTAVVGGAKGYGIVWELAATGAYTDLHDFGSSITISNGATGPDGQYPYAGVTLDSAGNLYGSTAYGGPNTWQGYSSGMIWKISKTGGYVDLHDFGGYAADSGGVKAPDGTRPWFGVSFDSAGNLYGAATYGGPNGEEGPAGGSGIVWSLTQTSIASFTLSPSTVQGGGTTTGTVTLGSPAPWGGLSLPLSSGSASVAVPFSVNVPTGSTIGTFQATAGTVNAQTLVSLAAGNGAGQKSATLTVNPVTLSSLSLSSMSLGGGITCTGTVTLSGPAPAGGTSVALSSSSAAATVPASVVVLAGMTTGTFTITTSAVGSATSVTINAVLNGSPQSAKLTLTPAALALLSLDPSSTTGGSSSTGTVSLSAEAFTGGFTVTLTCNSAGAIVPKSVTIPAGASSSAFTISTQAVSSQKTATITAKSGTTSKTAVLTILAPTLISLKLNPATIAPGGSSTGTVTINGPAPVGGLVVSLTRSSTKLTAPSTVKIAAGQTSATFAIGASKTAPAGPVTISATLSSVSQSATLIVS